MNSAYEEVIHGTAGGVYTTDAFSIVSIENGLFEENPDPSRSILQTEFIGDANDLASEQRFDAEKEYQDRAVVAVRLPGIPTIIQISPESEAVRFLRAAIVATHQDTEHDSFKGTTVGSKLADMHLVQNKQNPHKELTKDRIGGPLPREDQMARVIIRAFIHAAHFQTL